MLSLQACSTGQYYWQAVRGHVDLMSKRRPIAAVVADPATPAKLRETLQLVERMRRFAVSDLGLPDNGSYHSYAALGRPYVIWNVFSAPPLSVTPQEWCFPIAGCVAYRGYFARADADALAAQLRSEGQDVYVGGVPAYSTLGWLNDPVLSTFIHWPEVELARLLFHELAHQEAYAAGDTAFNEAFASAVEEVGVQRWIDHEQRPALREAWDSAQRHRRGFQTLVMGARADLASIYASAGSDSDKLRAKAVRLAQLQQDYAGLKREWGGFNGFDAWFAAGVNNAQLASFAVYTAEVPAFLALLQQEHGDLPQFYGRVRSLIARDPDERSRILARARGQQAQP